jgi:hypothetical protein
MVKGTGFSPYVNLSKMNRALAPEGRSPSLFVRRSLFFRSLFSPKNAFHEGYGLQPVRYPSNFSAALAAEGDLFVGFASSSVFQQLILCFSAAVYGSTITSTPLAASFA